MLVYLEGPQTVRFISANKTMGLLLHFILGLAAAYLLLLQHNELKKFGVFWLCYN